MCAQSKKKPKFASRHMLPCHIPGWDFYTSGILTVSRIVLRELALQGMIPGMRKASW